MKNKIQYHFLKRLIGYSVLLLVAEIVMQIILSYLFGIYEHALLVTGFIDMSAYIGRENGQLIIHYSDVVRIISFIILLVPYVIALGQMINKLIALPLVKITEAMTQMDGQQLSNRLEVPASYELLEMENAFNALLERLEQAAYEKTKLEDEKDLLITGMAHDLKTPITTIRGYTQALQEGLVQGEQQKEEYLVAIHQKAMQLDELINLLFDYVRLGTAQYRLQFEKVNLGELIKQNIGRFYTEFEERGIILSFDLPEEATWFQADGKQLSRVFANLLSNALKHNHEGDTVHIQMKLEDGINIIVEDTGDRIPEQIVEHLFNPFVMGDYSRKTGQGNGLGLCIAEKIINLHHGKLYLHTEKESRYTKSFIIKF